MTAPLSFDIELSELLADKKQCHEHFVNFFGHFLLWIRNATLRGTRKLVESEESREKLGAIRRMPYESVSQMAMAQREVALVLAEETLNKFLERLTWCLGDEGVDARFGSSHAYRFKVEMEIVDIESGELVHSEPINRGGKFFGDNWGKWLNRHRDK